MKVISTFMLCFLLFSCNNEQQKDLLSNSNKGHIYVKDPRRSLGTINEMGNSVLCVFNLKNTGGKTVVIHKIETSCGCLSASIPTKIIRPDETVLLTIKLNPKNQYGHFNKTVYVNSNADNSLLLLRVKGKIQ